MSIFEDMFIESSDGNSIQYKDKTLIRVDRFPVENGMKVRIIFERTNSEWKQGIRLRLEIGDFIVDEKTLKGKPGLVFWQDTTHAVEEVKICGPSGGELLIYNAWDTGDGVIEAWHNGAAMYVEEIENGRRYHCNDGHPDDGLDDLIFRIERVPVSV